MFGIWRMALLLAVLPAWLGAQATATRPAAPRPATTAAAVGAADDSLTTRFEVAGIPVILRRVGANNVVAANLYLLGGVRQLTPTNQGIENFLLEATERGTAKYPRDVLRNKMAQLGSVIAVSPGVDWTAIGLRSTVTNFVSSS
jgi:zinc protease